MLLLMLLLMVVSIILHDSRKRGTKVHNFRTFASHIVSDAEMIMPTSITDLLERMNGCPENTRFVVVGSGHSWSDVCIADQGTIRISLEKLPIEMQIDKDNHQVTCSAHITIENLQSELNKRSMSLLNMGEIRSQTIAGALATGTHGSGRLLTDSVISFSIISPEVHNKKNRSGFREFTVDQKNTNMFCAIFAQGSKGVITRVTLRITRKFYVRLGTKHNLDLEHFVTTEEPTLANFQGDKMYNTGCLDYYLVWPSKSDGHIIYSRFERSVLNNHMPIRTNGNSAQLRWLERQHQRFVSRNWNCLKWQSYQKVSMWLSSFFYRGTIDVMDMRTNYEDVIHWEMELALKKEDVYPFVHDVFEKHTLGHPLLMRILPPTDMPCQYSTSELRISVSFFVYRWDREARDFFLDVHRLGVCRYRARPHWGKIHFLSRADVSKIYGTEYATVRQKMLDHSFTNRYMARLFDKGVDPDAEQCFMERCVREDMPLASAIVSTQKVMRDLFQEGCSVKDHEMAEGFWMGESIRNPDEDFWRSWNNVLRKHFMFGWNGKYFGPKKPDGTQDVYPLCINIRGQVGVLPVYGKYDGKGNLTYNHFNIVDQLMKVDENFVIGYMKRYGANTDTGVYFTLRKV